MKIKLVCDKTYGNPNNGWIDAGFFESNILSEIIKKYTKDDVLNVTEEVVNYYNNAVERPHKKSFKNADSICKQLKKLNKIIEENKKRLEQPPEKPLEQQKEELVESLEWVVSEFEKVLAGEVAGNVVESLSYAKSLIKQYKNKE